MGNGRTPGEIMESWNLVKNTFTNRYIALAFRLFLGGVFIYASIYKIAYITEFAESIASYQIVPYWAVNIMAIILAWMELICGLLLVAGIRSKSAVVMIAFMLALFTAAMSISLIRGISMGCGCFSGTDAPITWKTLVRNIAWLAMAAHVYYFDSLFHPEKNIFTSISAMSHATHHHVPEADIPPPMRQVEDIKK